MFRLLAIGTAMTLLAGGALAAKSEAETFACTAAPEPVVSLSYGSRYTDASKTRSDLDEASNARVDEVLRPVESFVGQLMKMANAAVLDDDPAKAACVTDWLAQWADAGALRDLETMNVRLSIPARHAGLALALLEAETVAPLDPGKRRRIVDWLSVAAAETRTFFDTEAPPNASRNNLRAWAGLAAAAIGRLDNDAALLAWSRQSFELVACQAAPDGSLPLEMNRADRALNYQLHATAPLVVTAELLRATGYDGYAACDGSLGRIAAFTIAAVQDPELVEKLNGKQQTFSTGKQKLEPYMLAWVEPLLRHRPDAATEAFIGDLRPLGHAKLGGNLTELGDWTARLPSPSS